MSTTRQLLEAVKRRHGITSDYALAQRLGVSRQVISAYMNKRTTLGEAMCMRIADELGVPRAAVLAAMAGERTHDEEVRKVWRDAVKKLGGVAAAVMVLLGGGPTPPGASAAGPISHNQARNTQCPTTRRRRLTLGVALRWLAALAFPVALGACSTTVRHVSPPDWPELRVREHHVLAGEVYARCSKYVSAEMRALAWLTLTPPIINGCAEVDFRSMTCDIWVRGDLPDPDVLEHERAHCAGGDHAGEAPVLANAWAAWKAHHLRNANAYVYVDGAGRQVTLTKP